VPLPSLFPVASIIHLHATRHRVSEYVKRKKKKGKKEEERREEKR